MDQSDLTRILKSHLSTIEILGDNLTMVSRELMALELESIKFDTEEEIDSMRIQQELDLL